MCKVETGRLDGLTEDEGKVMDALVVAVNAWRTLPTTHPSEESDFINGIHTCQYLLGMRILRRDYPSGWPTYKK